jgi:RNA polymerase sigma factor (sigma-70 family)
MLFRQHYSFAMGIALRYTKDEQDASEIMSVSFVKVFKYLSSFDEESGNFFGWLKKIIINVALDFIKQRNKFSSFELETADEPIVNSSTLEKMDAEIILQLIKRLPPATHAVFVLYAIDGYSHKEIAIQLGISEGTSKWHLSEGRNFLQKKLLGK